MKFGILIRKRQTAGVNTAEVTEKPDCKSDTVLLCIIKEFKCILSEVNLQCASLLQRRVAVQPGSVQTGFSFLQLVQTLLDLCF